MTLPVWLIVGAAAVAIVGGGAAAGTILFTSGPLASSDREQVSAETPTATRPADASPSPTAVPTATPQRDTSPSPTAVPTAPPQPDARLETDEPFDPSALPNVDTSGWVAYEGPRGEFLLRTPPGWNVTVSEATNYTSEIVVGDAAHVFNVAKPGKYDFRATAGDVVADIFTSPDQNPYEPHQDVLYQTTIAATVSGRATDILAIQYEREPGFDPGLGMLTLFVSLQSPAGQYLTGAINVVLPADLSRVAEALAVLTEMTLR